MTEQERRENSGRGKAKTQWEKNEEWREERAESHAGDLRGQRARGSWGGWGEDGEGREGDTPLSQEQTAYPLL